MQVEDGFTYREQTEKTDTVTLLMLASCFGVPSLVSKLLEAGEKPLTLPQVYDYKSASSK